MRKIIGVLGGTFDPVHFGHLRLALDLKQELQLDEMRLLPCRKPVHRELPQASSDQRLAMLKLAVQECPDLLIDARELKQDRPSYMVDTLKDMRNDWGNNVSLVLAMGIDAFAALETWHLWQDLVRYAHLVVIERPGWALPDSRVLMEFLKQHQTKPSSLQTSLLKNNTCGSIVMCNLRLMPISSTEIRRKIQTGDSPQFLLPDAVLKYIKKHKLYL